MKSPAPKACTDGFTLIELLIVIAIIAILSVVGVVVFTNVTKGARDTRRKADIDAIAKAYEVGYVSRYVPLSSSAFASGTVPQDPNSTKGNYFNWLASDGSGFKICASLDNNPGSICNTSGADCYCKASSQGTVNTSVPPDSSTDMATIAVGLAGSVMFGSGTDGSANVATSTNLNTDSLVNGRSCADAVSYNVISLGSNTAVLSSSPSSDCLIRGDEVLLINLQGTSANNGNVGNWETFRVSSISSNTVTFTANKTKSYGDGSSDSNIGTAGTSQRVMLQRVPNYSDVNIAGGAILTANAWDGTKGGVLFFRASGNVNVQSGGNISMAGKGYRGGGAGAWGTAAGYQGESYGGTGIQSQSANLGGGGGGGIYSTAAGGGSYGTTGGYGGYGVSPDPGTTYGQAALTQLFMGSAGGGQSNGLTGRNGGGIVFITADNLTATGTINNDGASPGGNISNTSGAGSGGSVYLTAPTLIAGSSLVTASGGLSGSDQGRSDGGSGRIRLNSGTLSGTTNPAFYNGSP